MLVGKIKAYRKIKNLLIFDIVTFFSHFEKITAEKTNKKIIN